MAGIDPIAKRPRALDPAPQAASRQMDAAEVAAGLCDVHGLVIRDEAYAAQLADFIDSNAVILTEVISRMKAVEAMVAQQGADAMQLHDKLVQEDLRIDTQLRGELGVMAQRLLDHDSELKAKLATEASKVADKVTAFEDALTRFQLGATPGVESHPGSGASIAALDGVRVSISLLEVEARASADRAKALTAGGDSTAQKLMVVHGELEALKVNMGQLAGAFQAQAAQPHHAGSFAAGRGVDPMQAGTSWDGAQLGGQQSAPAASSFHMGTPPHHPHEQRDRKFQLYDEKFVLSGKGSYDARKPQIWLLSLRNYLAGRHEEMDPILDWCEQQLDVIPRDAKPPAMMDAEPAEVSRQLWAFLGPLVAGDASMESIFANVPRHHGFDA